MSGHKTPESHIVLTSHPRRDGKHPRPVEWDAADPAERGPVIGTLTDPANRNVIGAHAGAYAIYRALAVASGTLDPMHRPDLSDTSPSADIGPHPQWSEPGKIVAMDPWGHLVHDVFARDLAEGWDIRPTVAVTRARITVPELRSAVEAGRLSVDGEILNSGGEVACTKIAIEPVWYLPGVAERCEISERELRRGIFQHTGGMFPELITRPDLKVFLPPIGGQTLYLFGSVGAISDSQRELACRVHDECNGSDVFGSDICTCRPYLTHGIEVCIETAQQGGAGLIVYNRKEGRALGEVTKFLVYNARKRKEGGDRAEAYFERTACVAGIEDARCQELMPDCLHWLGIRRIDRFVSMSDMKYDAITRQGIEIARRIPIPEELVPGDAHVEIEAKKSAGYYHEEPDRTRDAVGRALDEY
jgi:GTP cyclohydrolase II